MYRILFVLAVALFSMSCDAAHAHVRAVTHSDPVGAVKNHFSFFLQHGATDVAGKWEMTMETPHGVAKGPLELKQEGVKLTAKWVSDQVGTLKGTGTIEGKAVSFTMDAPNGQAFTFKGSLEPKKMGGTTEMGGAWSASR